MASSKTTVPPLVDYLIARSGLPERRGLAYDYVLAGDGLFLAAENRLLSVRVPVAPCTVRGLPPVYGACTLTFGRLPLALWQEMLGLAHAVGVLGREAVFTVTHEGDEGDDGHEGAGYRLAIPHQVAGATRVLYRPPSAAVLELHSHHVLPACFSRQDDADEQRLCLYGVVGRLDRERPEIALRVGAYGHFLPVPWDSVFDVGDADRQTMCDVTFDAPEPPQVPEPTEPTDEPGGEPGEGEGESWHGGLDEAETRCERD